MSRQFALGCIFRACRNFWESTDFYLVLSQKFLQIQNLHRNPFDCDCANANQLRISTNLNNSSLRDSALCAESWQSTFKNAESNADSTESQNLVKNKSKKTYKSFCFVLLSQNEESPLPLNPNLPSKADLQNPHSRFSA